MSWCAAWYIYLADAPLYSSRSGCRQNHQVCVVLQTHRVMIDERKEPSGPSQCTVPRSSASGSAKNSLIPTRTCWSTGAWISSAPAGERRSCWPDGSCPPFRGPRDLPTDLHATAGSGAHRGGKAGPAGAGPAGKPGTGVAFRDLSRRAGTVAKHPPRSTALGDLGVLGHKM